MSSGGAASSAKGTRYEQELTSTLRDLGFGALRIPSSGSATDEDLPDVLSGRNYTFPVEWDEFDKGQMLPSRLQTVSEAWAIEVKAGDATTLYVDEAEVNALIRFAGHFGATPYLGARFTTQGTPTTHYLVEPGNARITDGGHYGLPVNDIEDRASVKIHPGDEPDVEEVQDV